jgi:hypothetical protein
MPASINSAAKIDNLSMFPSAKRATISASSPASPSWKAEIRNFMTPSSLGCRNPMRRLS